jgi:hypothetical protein
MYRRYARRLAAVAIALMLVTGAGLSSAAPKPKKSDAPPAAGDKDKPFQEWSKVTKDAEKISGFLTFHKKRDNLYLEISESQLGQPFLGVYSLASGMGSNFILGGMPLWLYTGRDDHLLELRREGDYVLVLEKNARFVAPSGTPYEKARDLSYGHSVLARLKIESINDESKALLVDFAPFVVSDISDMAEALRNAINKPFRFEKERSTLTRVKAFPENTEIEALLTYAPNDRNNLSLPTISDERYLPLTLHYSFSKLPEKPMAPRLADSRTGYFVNAYKDFSLDLREDYWQRFINRWRLEKKDPSAKVSEPVKPIVYYIDRTVPEQYRPAIKKGVESWQKAFEAAGFKNAIIAKDAPDDPDWDPEDVRYSTIRWIVSSEPSFGAIGPSRVDPRTGEILDADIAFEGSIVQRRLGVFRQMTNPQTLAQYATPWMIDPPKGVRLDRICMLQGGMMEGLGLAYAGMLLDGTIAPGSPMEEKYIEEMLTHVTLHEVGHTLGLTHNFRSSTSTPRGSLHDRSWTEEHGLTSSVMDYATPNLSLDRAKQGDYYGITAGTCDLWNIRYGYEPSGVTDLDADYAYAKKIADESAMAGHEYSDDSDTYPTDALDPRTNIWDLGDDPLAFAKERSAYVQSLWKNPQFEQKLLGDQGEYPTLRRAMDGLIGQYAIALGLAVKYVGGQYQSRDHRGQPEAHQALEPVPAARQREALDFLSQRAFAQNAFGVPTTLLNRLGQDRWNHWGVNDAFSRRLDYDLNDKMFVVQNALLNALTAPRLMLRLREAESRSADAFRLSELFDRLTRMTWGEVGGASPVALKGLEGPHTRREVQRAYVDRLAMLLVSPPATAPGDARALARLQLQRIDARAAKVLGGETPIGDYTRAHLLESRARIKRAMDASRTVAERPVAAPGANAME